MNILDAQHEYQDLMLHNRIYTLFSLLRILYDRCRYHLFSFSFSLTDNRTGSRFQFQEKRLCFSLGASLEERIGRKQTRRREANTQ